MTLDLKKLIVNAVRRQMSIQHFQANVQVFKRDEMPEWVTGQIKAKFGESYGADGDWWVWLSSKELSKDSRETAFNVLNSALGEAANNMTDTDLKIIALEKPAEGDAVDESVENPEEGEKFMFLKVTIK